jgi:hypothetical protein
MPSCHNFYPDLNYLGKLFWIMDFNIKNVENFLREFLAAVVKLKNS